MANKAVYGIIQGRSQVEHVIQSLVDLGINSRDISFLSGQHDDFKDIQTTYLADANRNSYTDTDRNWRNEQRIASDEPVRSDYHTTPSNLSNLDTEKNSKAPEGAATGATTGGIIGGVLGLLAGLGALAIPGMGPFIAAGPIMGALSGLGLGGALGGVVGALIGLGIPEYEAKLYEGHLKNGGTLIAIHVNSDEWAKKVETCLEKHGVKDISISSEATFDNRK